MHRLIDGLTVAVLAACTTAGALAQEPPRYRVRDLGTLIGLQGIAVAAINNHGDIALSDSVTERSYLWRGGKLHDLGRDSEIFDLNDRGEVVGTLDTGEAGYAPFLWRHGRFITLNHQLGSDDGGASYAINAHGQVVGVVGDRGFLFDGKHARYLDAPGASRTVALDINDRSEILGSALYEGKAVATRAFILRDGSITPLPQPIVFQAGGSYTGTAINNAGTVAVRYFDNALGQGGSALYAGGRIIDYGLDTYLDTLNNLDWGVGVDIAGTATPSPLLFHGEAIYDLNQWLSTSAAPGWKRLDWAVDINDRGQIAGRGTRTDGSVGAFIATPVPEAPAVLSLIVGLGILGAALRLQRHWGVTEIRRKGPRPQRRPGQLTLIGTNAAAVITSLCGWLAAILSTMAFASAQAAPPKFHWEVVGSEIGWPFNITGFNNAGQLVGADNQGTFISTNGERSYLPSLSTPGFFASQGLNDHGSVMGSVFAIGSSVTSYLYQNGQYVDLTSQLGPSPPTNPSFSYSLNNLDHVVGIHRRSIFYYNGKTTNYIEYNNTPIAYRGRVDINDHDVVVGTTSIDEGPDQGFIYANGNLNFAPGFEGISAINDAGQFVGIGSLGEGRAKPVLFDNGGIRALGTFGGNYGMAKDINNHGAIVGEAERANGWLASFYYEDGKMYNLRGLLLDGGASEWILGQYGSDMRINDAGQILVNAYRSDRSWGTYRLLLTPVPEAPPWILALSGLGFLFLLRRHASRHVRQIPLARCL